MPSVQVVADNAQPYYSEFLEGPGTYELVFSAKDGSGNAISHSLTVTLADTEAPSEVASCFRLLCSAPGAV